MNLRYLHTPGKSGERRPLSLPCFVEGMLQSLANKNGVSITSLAAGHLTADIQIENVEAIGFEKTRHFMNCGLSLISWNEENFGHYNLDGTLAQQALCALQYK